MAVRTVYIELVFLDNFAINWLAIFAAAAFTKTRMRAHRFALAAAIGGIYACLAIGFGGWLWSFAIKIAVSALMCAAAFYARGQRGFWRNLLAFYASSFLFAGAVYAVSFAFGDPAAQGGALSVRPLVRYILSGLGAGSLIALLR